jgi:hypothetical protein
MTSSSTDRDIANRPKASEHDTEADADVQKGAVEDDRPRTAGHTFANSSMSGQQGHHTNSGESQELQDSRPELQSDTDFPEPGSSPEHSGQHR